MEDGGKPHAMHQAGRIRRHSGVIETDAYGTPLKERPQEKLQQDDQHCPADDRDRKKEHDELNILHILRKCAIEKSTSSCDIPITVEHFCNLLLQNSGNRDREGNRYDLLPNP